MVRDMAQKEQERIQQFAAKHLGEDKGVIIDCAVVQAVCDKHLIQQECRTLVALVESSAIDQEAIPGCFAQEITEDIFRMEVDLREPGMAAGLREPRTAAGLHWPRTAAGLGEL